MISARIQMAIPKSETLSTLHFWYFSIFFPYVNFTLCLSASKDSGRGPLRLEKSCQEIMAGHPHLCLHAFLIQENHGERDLTCYPKIPLGLELREPESLQSWGHWGSESCQGDHIRAPVFTSTPFKSGPSLD